MAPLPCMNPARAHLRLKALPSMVGWSPAHITYALIWAIVDLAVSMLTPATGPEAPEASRSDGWAELTPGLKCAVCHEVMHRPCALMPCMHRSRHNHWVPCVSLVVALKHKKRAAQLLRRLCCGDNQVERRVSDVPGDDSRHRAESFGEHLRHCTDISQSTAWMDALHATKWIALTRSFCVRRCSL